MTEKDKPDIPGLSGAYAYAVLINWTYTYAFGKPPKSDIWSKVDKIVDMGVKAGIRVIRDYEAMSDGNGHRE